MLKKRVIPVLLLKDGRMVKGVRFANFRDTGNPRTTVRIYSAQDADELAFLDIEQGVKSRDVILSIIRDAALECFMPLTAGGGIQSLDDIREFLLAGADKVIITTAAVMNPEMIASAAKKYGSQCIVAGIDYKGVDGEEKVWIRSGSEATDLNPIIHAQRLVELGAGEIFLNSIDRDGTMEGYDLSFAEKMVNAVSVPVIVCGGAGNFMHLAELLQKTEVSAAACASIFHFGDNNPIRARSYLRNQGVPMRVLK